MKIKIKSITTLFFSLLLVTITLSSYGEKKNIIFDLGGVLIADTSKSHLSKLFNNNQNEVWRFLKITHFLEKIDELNLGAPLATVRDKLKQEFPEYEKILDCIEPTAMYGEPMEDSVKILKSLYQQGYNLYLLSNWPGEFFHQDMRNNPKYKYFLDLFKDIVISADVGKIKPDPEIYKILIQKNSLDPKDCIFIDDSAKNLPPAEKLEITIIKFESPQQLREDLGKLGVIVDEHQNLTEL